MSDLKQVRARRQRRALEILAGEPEGLTGLALWDRVRAEYPIEPAEEGFVKDGKTPRARVYWMFQTSKMTLAGWLAKSTMWRVTAAGVAALQEHPDSEDFAAAADEAERRYRDLVRPGLQPGVSTDVLASMILPSKGDPSVRRAARNIIDRGLGDGDSLFAAGSGAWSAESVAVLHERYTLAVDESDDKFLDKLAKQLDGAPDAAIILAAEMVALLSLPLASVTDATKRHRMRRILGWCSQPVTIPLEVNAAFSQGAWHGGQGANMLLWRALSDLVEFTRDWWRIDAAAREQLLSDPWAWGAHVDGSAALTMPSTQGTLKYLAFPNTYLPNVSSKAKEAIRAAFAAELSDPTGELDEDLFAITTALQVRSASSIDYYQPPWINQWDPEAAKAARRAWLVRGSSVSGVNLVPHWLADGFVSLPAKALPRIELPATKDSIGEAVKDGYATRTQTYRRSKLEDYDRFLRRMRPGDVVVTTSEGQMYLGALDGPAVWDEETELPARIQRPVAWHNPDAGVPYPDLPDPLPARLGATGDIVDLTDDLPAIDELLTTSPDDEKDEVLVVVVPKPEIVSAQPVQLSAPGPDLATTVLIPQEWLAGLVTLLNRRRQVILYGPPGTGKTFIAQHLAEHFCEPGDAVLVQFHPSYAYEDFVMGYRPVKTDSGVAFELKNGPLMRIAEQARDHRTVAHFLIIDEINRANLAKVFGELYFLLEYRDRSIQLLYSEEGGEDFFLPDNLFVIGTMNTADRSIALVDAAMRRRFAFKELHPSVEPVASVLRKWLASKDHPAHAADLLDALNSRIPDRDFQIGPSYFMKDWIHADPDGLATVWETDLLPLLQEHHSGDGTNVSSQYRLPVIEALVARTALVGDAASATARQDHDPDIAGAVGVDGT